MTNSYRRLGLAAAVLGVLALAACSSDGGQASPAPSSSAAAPSTTVMAGGDKHTILTEVECTRAAAQPDAVPAESGIMTTRISAHDDSSSVSLALSDEQPPTVDGFSLSLVAGPGQYLVPYQATLSPAQVHATKDGKSYTVTGTGDGVSPNLGDVHQVTFGIHVTCP